MCVPPTRHTHAAEVCGILAKRSLSYSSVFLNIGLYNSDLSLFLASSRECSDFQEVDIPAYLLLENNNAPCQIGLLQCSRFIRPFLWMIRVVNIRFLKFHKCNAPRSPENIECFLVRASADEIPEYNLSIIYLGRPNRSRTYHSRWDPSGNY